jgi:hypothetical protein
MPVHTEAVWLMIVMWITIDSVREMCHVIRPTGDDAKEQQGAIACTRGPTIEAIVVLSARC